MAKCISRSNDLLPNIYRLVVWSTERFYCCCCCCWELLLVVAGCCRVCVRLLKFSHENSVNCKHWNWILSQNRGFSMLTNKQITIVYKNERKTWTKTWKSSVDVKCTRYSYKYYSLTFQLVLCASASPSGSSVDVIFFVFYLLFWKTTVYSYSYSWTWTCNICAEIAISCAISVCFLSLRCCSHRCINIQYSI